MFVDFKFRMETIWTLNKNKGLAKNANPLKSFSRRSRFLTYDLRRVRPALSQLSNPPEK